MYNKISKKEPNIVPYKKQGYKSLKKLSKKKLDINPFFTGERKNDK